MEIGVTKSLTIGFTARLGWTIEGPVPCALTLSSVLQKVIARKAASSILATK